jgi:hypothetical protein
VRMYLCMCACVCVVGTDAGTARRTGSTTGGWCTTPPTPPTCSLRSGLSLPPPPLLSLPHRVHRPAHHPPKRVPGGVIEPVPQAVEVGAGQELGDACWKERGDWGGKRVGSAGAAPVSRANSRPLPRSCPLARTRSSRAAWRAARGRPGGGGGRDRFAVFGAPIASQQNAPAAPSPSLAPPPLATYDS